MINTTYTALHFKSTEWVVATLLILPHCFVFETSLDTVDFRLLSSQALPAGISYAYGVRVR